MTQSGLLVARTKAAATLAVVALFLAAGCKTQSIDSFWLDQPIKADGQRNEWSEVPFNYFEDKDVALGISNDLDNLYIFFSFKDPQWARAIRMSGLTFWLNADGKKKQDFGLRFRGGPPIEQLGLPEGGALPDKFTWEQKDRFSPSESDTATRFTIIYDKNDRETNVSLDGTLGPAAGFSTSQANGIHTYEFEIPLSGSNTVPFGIGARPGETICIGAQWGGIDRRDGKRPEGGIGGRPDGMGGGPGGMGGFPGGPGGGKPANTRAMEKQEIWLKVRLALSPEEKSG